MADGRVVIITDFETEEVISGTDDIIKACRRMAKDVDHLSENVRNSFAKQADAIQKAARAYEDSENKIGEMKRQLEELKEQKIPTEGYKNVQKQIGDTEKKLSQLLEKQAEWDKYGAPSGQSYEKLKDKIEQAKLKLQELNTEKAKMESDNTAFISGADTEKAAELEKKITSELQKQDERARSLTTSYNHLSEMVNKYSQEIANASTETEDLTEAENDMSEASKKAGQTTSELEEAENDMSKASKKAGQTTSELESRLTKLSGVVKKLAGIVASAFAIKKIMDFGKEATALGSDLAEVQNVVDVTFTTMSEKVNEFAQNAMFTAGLSETMAKQYVGTFGAMAKSFGFTEDEAYKMSTALTQLSGDVASFYNISQDEAYTKLKSVFTGETETLKELGIVMTQNALDSYAMANGYGKTTSAMTEQEKVALRYKFVLDQLSGASGDFLRTSDGWANQVRVMQLQISSLKATIGQGLINIFSPVLKVINIVLARLATVANAFKAFTELITGGKAQGGGNTGIVEDMANVSDSYDTAADSANNYGDAVGGAGKAAEKAGKEAEGALASFDKLNVQADQSGSAGGGGGAGGIGGGGALSQVQDVDYGKLAEGEKATDKLSEALEMLIKRFKELKDLFIKGFKIGVGDLSVLDSIKNNLKIIKDSFINIFTDGEVLSSANRMLDTLAYDMGRIAGSVVSVGLTIADNIVGGFASYVSSAQERIKQYLISMFDISSAVSTISADFAVAIADIFSVFRGDTAKQVTADIIAIFTDTFMGITEIVAKLFRDILDIILTPFTKNADKFKEALENFLKPLETILKTLRDSVVETFDELNKMYDKHLKPLFDSIRDGISQVVETFLDGFNKYLAPVLDKLAKKFDEVWKNTIQPLMNNIIGLIGDIADLTKALWEKILQPLLNWFAANVFPIIAPIVEKIGIVFLNVFDSIGKILNTFVALLRTIIQFITDVFQTGWGSAWDNMKKKFSTMWESLPGIVTGIVNKIISGVESMLNGVIGGLNKFTTKINGVIGKIPGVSAEVIPSVGEIHLPRLASGTVVPPRAGEFAAILGDNNRESEVVSPLSTMKQALKEALQESGGIGNGGEIVGYVYLDGKEMGKSVVKFIRQEKDRTGRNPVMV